MKKMKKYGSNILKDRWSRRYEQLGGAEEACLAHNQKVSGSKPLPAKLVPSCLGTPRS